MYKRQGKAPTFGELKEGRYLSAAVLDRELKAKRRMILLDTRVTSMWQMAHIEGSVPAPYYANREEVVANLPRDGTWIVAYCECPRAAADSVVTWLREEGKLSLIHISMGWGSVSTSNRGRRTWRCSAQRFISTTHRGRVF